MAINYAAKYADKVDERFYRESQIARAVNNEFSFVGVKTVKIYSLPTVAMGDYTRSGSNRYGSPTELQDSVQEMTLSRDRAFTFTIDRGNKNETMMVRDAGRALNRQIREVVVPEIDTYAFDKIARNAFTAGHTDATAATKSNAYSLLLAAQEHMGNAMGLTHLYCINFSILILLFSNANQSFTTCREFPKEW